MNNSNSNNSGINQSYRTKELSPKTLKKLRRLTKKREKKKRQNTRRKAGLSNNSNSNNSNSNSNINQSYRRKKLSRKNLGKLYRDPRSVTVEPFVPNEPPPPPPLNPNNFTYNLFDAGFIDSGYRFRQNTIRPGQRFRRNLARNNNGRVKASETINRRFYSDPHEVIQLPHSLPVVPLNNIKVVDPKKYKKALKDQRRKMRLLLRNHRETKKTKKSPQFKPFSKRRTYKKPLNRASPINIQHATRLTTHNHHITPANASYPEFETKVYHSNGTSSSSNNSNNNTINSNPMYRVYGNYENNNYGSVYSNGSVNSNGSVYSNHENNNYENNYFTRYPGRSQGPNVGLSRLHDPRAAANNNNNHENNFWDNESSENYLSEDNDPRVVDFYQLHPHGSRD